jgi:hypothetical protein
MGAARTIDEIDASLAILQPKLDQLAGMPDSIKIGPNSASGIGKAYQRVKDRIEELCREREALVENAGCPLPTRGEV